MPASTIIKQFEDGSLVTTDGAAHALTVPFDMGDLKVSGINAEQTDVNEYQTRGRFRSLRKGKDTHPTGSFSCALADYSDVANQTVIDFLLKKGSYAANTSTLSGSDVYTIDLKLTVNGVALGDPANHTVLMEDCRVTADLSEGEPNTVSFSFEIYGAVTIT